MNLPASFHMVMWLPLDTLWDDEGDFGRRIRNLDKAQLRAHVARRGARIVIARCGSPLTWMQSDRAREFLKAISDNIADPEGFHADEYPGGFAYLASEWDGRNGKRLIVFEEYR